MKWVSKKDVQGLRGTLYCINEIFPSLICRIFATCRYFITLAFCAKVKKLQRLCAIISESSGVRDSGVALAIMVLLITAYLLSKDSVLIVRQKR